MQPMRELIRGSLARSLQKMADEDRLAAALPVVCGSVLASHCELVHLAADGVLVLQLDAPEWVHSLRGMGSRLQLDLQRVAGVPLSALHFKHGSSQPRLGKEPKRARAVE